MDLREAESKRIREIYRDLLGFCKPFIKRDEQKQLRKAFELVLQYHRPDWERTGEEYVFHSIEVARIALKELNLGVTSVICALLHNVVDDFDVQLKEIKEQFGKDVAETDCQKYLLEQEMENPLYRLFTRTGCAICPAQSDRAWFEVYKHYPDTWEYMRWIEKRLFAYIGMGYDVVNPYWFSGKRRIEDMENQFKKETASLFDFSDEPLKDCFCKI